MDIQTLIMTVAVPLVLLGLAFGARWLAARYHENTLLTRAFAFVELMGTRGRTKYLAEIEAAKSPDSPGGVEVTPEEASALREKLWQITLKEAPGAIRDTIITQIGPEAAKGIIGEKLEKPTILGIPGDAVTAEAVGGAGA